MTSLNVRISSALFISSSNLRTIGLVVSATNRTGCTEVSGGTSTTRLPAMSRIAPSAKERNEEARFTARS